MGYYREKIEGRQRADEAALRDAFAALAAPLQGQRARAHFLGEAGRAQNALGEIFDYYRLRAPEVEADGDNASDAVRLTLRRAGLRARAVSLSGHWYKEAVGPMLATASGATVALLPRALCGYRYTDWTSGKSVAVHARVAQRFAASALALYRPLPPRPLDAGDLVRHAYAALHPVDVALPVALAAVGGLLAVVPPVVLCRLFEGSGGASEASRIPLSLLILSLSLIAGTFIGAYKRVHLARVAVNISLCLHSALFDRLLSLKSSFFREHPCGALAGAVIQIKDIPDLLARSLFKPLLAALFSPLLLLPIHRYAPSLLPATAALLAASLFCILIRIRVSAKRALDASRGAAQVHALVLQHINNIEAVKTGGAQTRAFAIWAKTAAGSLFKRVPSPHAPSTTLLIMGAGLAPICRIAGARNIPLPHFIAFIASYALIARALFALERRGGEIARLSAIRKRLQPILNATPETHPHKKIVRKLSGAIELDNVSFSYGEGGPAVLKNLSLAIQRGESVAVVGASGSGKSALVRILLGLERPQRGAVYYDRASLQTLDPPSLRRHIGTVLQESRLVAGSIYENIALSTPRLTLERAWEAAELANIARDIKEMPLGMDTPVGIGPHNLSSGQAQRILIARALASRPAILILDDAFGKLDADNQSAIAGKLETHPHTRITIASRADALRRIPRILVLHDGRIAEDGPYDALIARNGPFASLMSSRIETEN
ncbi:MAG: ATP-binding cassette domain-containing protein [Spirochaetaceae bacterium]|jgi:ABC-type bacteriocin/lantibiotic exporter with double-glycine peptidase domain|nr:ATP-binding cassette domain-containing protein [Spirochaetaceae bacterium]